SYVLYDLRNGFAIVLLGIFELLANLPIGFSFPNHGHIWLWQMPVWCARRHVEPGDVFSLMTRAALLSGYALPDWSTFDVLCVRMTVVSLSRKVAIGVTVETPWMFEHWHDRREGSARTCIIALNSCARRDSYH